MKLHVKVLIVGGGVVGASIAYHLQKGGWDNIVLIERDELTSGSTWHAAGLLPLFNMSYATSHIHDYSVKFYKKLEKELNTDIGFKVVGNLRMAQTQDRMDEFMLYSSTADTVNIPYEWKNPKQIKDRWPLVYSEDLKGAIYHPTDGYINPADLTQAIARSARSNDVKIERKTQADSFYWDGNSWHVQCSKMFEKGGNLLVSQEKITYIAEHVVTATGNHVQNTSKLINTKIAAIPVEHQYIVTEEDPKLIEYRKNNDEHPVLRDADAKWYVREERGGWILGPYEKNAPARFQYNVPDSFRADLFPLELERIENEYLSFIKRIPSSETLGIKDDFNGPICYTPDGNPLLGPAFGLRNLWLAEGFSFGITAAGGAGYYLAQMMINGEAEIDMTSLDPKRYGSWITTEYTSRKNEECYEHVYILHHPDEERPACRPLRTFPCYDRLKKLGAQNIKFIGNLKFSQSENKIEDLNKDLKKFINSKKTWCASSTHNTEERFCAIVHKKLKKKYKNFLTIIIPSIDANSPREAKAKGSAIIPVLSIVAAIAIDAIMAPQYDSKISEPMPATSPTLSPTLSAITPGFLGSSSGIPASTFPTKSAPTSALFV